MAHSEMASSLVVPRALVACEVLGSKTDEAAGNLMEDGPKHPRKPRPKKKKLIMFGLDSVNTYTEHEL